MGMNLQKSILLHAIKRLGNLPEVHRELIKAGVKISHTALSNFVNGKSKNLRFDVTDKLVELVYAGDWNAAKADAEKLKARAQP